MFIKQQTIEIKENNKIKILSPFYSRLGDWKAVLKPLETMTPSKTKKGEDYSRSSLLGFRNVIERYLNNAPFKRGIKMPGNPVFQSSNKILDAKIKMLKKRRERKHYSQARYSSWRSNKIENLKCFPPVNSAWTFEKCMVSHHSLLVSPRSRRSALFNSAKL